MNVYELEKWYFDLLTSDGEYLFGYFARNVLIGHTDARLHICLADCDTTLSRTFPVNIRSIEPGSVYQRIVTDQGVMTFTPTTASINMKTDGLALDLEYQVDSPWSFTDQPLVIPGPGESRVLWHPVLLKGIGTGSVTLDGRENRVIHSDGYVDYLHSNLFPIRVPVDDLSWGRFHSPECDFTWTHVRCHDRTIAGLHGRIGMVSLSLTDVDVVTDTTTGSGRPTDDIPNSTSLQARGPDVDLAVEIGPYRLSVASDFIDSQAVKNPLLRYLLSRLSRNPRSVKFMSHADVRLKFRGEVAILESVPLIHEFVHFGKA